MNVPPAVQHPIPDNIRVFWINEYECWAGESLEACVQASMKEFGVKRSEATDEGAYEVTRDKWDEIKCPNDPDEQIFYTSPKPVRGQPYEIDWERTAWETIRQSVASHDAFPVMIGGRE